MLVAAVLFGSTGTARALGPAAASPVAVGALRLVVGGVALAGLATLRRAPVRGCLDREVRGSTIVGALAVAAYQACFFAAVKLAGVALGTLVAIGAAPALAGLFGLALHERPTRRWAFATAVALGGCGLLLVPGEQSGARPLGLLLALGAAASYAAFTVASRKIVLHTKSPDAVMAVLFMSGAILVLPVLAVQDLSWLADRRGLVMIAWLGLVATAAAYWLFARGLARLSAATATALDLAEPLTATTLGVLVLGERLVALSLVGAVLVAIGLVVLTVPAPRAAK